MPSTVIAHFNYDAESFQLKITFRSGKVYLYKNVPPEIYGAFEISGSKGKYFNAYIKNHYEFDLLK